MSCNELQFHIISRFYNFFLRCNFLYNRQTLVNDQKKKLKSNWLKCFIIAKIMKWNETNLSSLEIYHVWPLMSINKLPEALVWEIRNDENKIWYNTTHVLIRRCLHSQMIMNIFCRVHYSFIMNCFKPQTGQWNHSYKYEFKHYWCS